MRAIQTHLLTPESIAAMSESEGLWTYNGLDCCVTSEVLEVIKPQLDEVTGPTYEFSKALQAPVLEMRVRGVLVDERWRQKTIENYQRDLATLKAQLDQILEEGVGHAINWNSPAQLKRLLYEVIGLPPQKKRGAKGEWGLTVNREALEKLESYFLAQPIIRHILALRDIAKKIGVLRTSIDPDGRMRTSYNIAGTTTGRFSSSLSDFGTGTNLQNIEEQLRRPFVADPGFKFAYIDLEQAESRLVGAIEWNLFGDPRYLDACESGDLHTYVCRLAWPQLPWTGDIKKDKDVAETPFYRQHSHRHMAKVLGHGCLTADHEVLTRQGWVSIAEKPKEILTWNDSVSFFDKVSRWEHHPYTGNLQSFEGNSISALMTHDHRVPYKSDQRSFVRERPAESGPGILMPLGDNYIGGSLSPKARLIAAVMSNGYIMSGKSTQFHFRKQRKKDRLKELCDQVGVPWNESGDKIRIEFVCDKQAGAYMLNWSRQALFDFLDEYKFWDGHQAPTSTTLFSSNRDHLEWIQTLGRICGIGGQIQKPFQSGFGTTIWRLQQNNRKWAAGKSIKHTQHPVENQEVYCPTVPTGWFYVRRNGKIFVTGNTNYNGKPYTMAQHTKLEAPLIQQFQTKYFNAFPAHQQWHNSVAVELLRHGFLTTLTGRRRYFFGRRNEDTTVREAIAYNPQGSVGDILNRGMLQVWRLGICQLLLQIHDAILIQYPEAEEDTVIPAVLAALAVPITLREGRVLTIPSEAQTGWNWAKFNEKTNPDGLMKYRGKDARTRTETPARELASILDRIY